MDIRFGYRTRKDGNFAIVAWLPDLFEKSKAHIDRWAAFQLKDPEWKTEYDERFTNWVRRYLGGNWEVDNGPSYYLAETIKVINALTSELVGIPLYKHQPDETLSYPAAENTHRYQDSPKELYGYLIDGLAKECISRLAARLGKNIKVGDKNTIQALKKVEYGFHEHIENVHESEVLIIYFTDGSIMSINTWSNAWNLSDDEKGLRPDDFRVDFVIHWGS